jgi:hypothetical protein
MTRPQSESLYEAHADGREPNKQLLPTCFAPRQTSRTSQHAPTSSRVYATAWVKRCSIKIYTYEIREIADIQGVLNLELHAE